MTNITLSIDGEDFHVPLSNLTDQPDYDLELTVKVTLTKVPS